MKTSCLSPLLGVLALALLRAPGHAADYTATLPPNGTWTSPAIWSGGSSYPSAANDTAKINYTASSANASLSVYANISLLAVTTEGSGSFSLQLSGGPGGTYGLSSGTLTHKSGQLQFLNGSSGTFSVTAGTLNIESGNLRLGLNSSNSLNSFIVNGATTLSSGAFLSVESVTNRPKLGHLDAAGTLTVSTGSVNGSMEVSSLTGGGTIRASNGNTSATAATLYLNNTNATPATFSGVLRDRDTGTTTAKLSVVKKGAGEQTLSGASLYTGTTTLLQGRLVLSGAGSINSSGQIIVDGGELAARSNVAVNAPVTFTSGRLSGNGRINQELAIAANRILAPGSDNLTFGADQSWAEGGMLELTLGPTAGGSLTLLGDLDLSALSSSLTFTLALTEGEASSWVAVQPYQWKIAEVQGDLLLNATPVNDLFSLDLAGWTTAGDFEVFTSGDDLMLQFVAIPEGTTFLYLLAGGALLLNWRRRLHR